MSLLEDRYGSLQSSTPGPRSTRQVEIGANLHDSLFEAGGSRRHLAPMPIKQGQGRDLVAKGQFAQQKQSFEQQRMDEMDRMTQEFEQMSQDLANLRNERTRIDVETQRRKRDLEERNDELQNLEDQYERQQEKLKRRTENLQDQQEAALKSSEETHQTLREATDKLMDDRSKVTQELHDLKREKDRLQRQVHDRRKEVQDTTLPSYGSNRASGYSKVNGGIYHHDDSSSGGASASGHRPEERHVRIAESESEEETARSNQNDRPHSTERNSRAPTSDTRKISRRESMSPGMRKIYDANPCIATLGVDCVSRNSDNAEIVDWSVTQSRRLHRDNQNPAKRVATQPKPFDGRQPWQDWFADFMDDMRYNRWSEEEALDELLRALRNGPGKLAVSRWRQIHRNGSFTQLVECASYLIGIVGNEDPLRAFKKRTQKPYESHRVFGLELQNLLQRARPRWELDDTQFLDDLFTQFIEGLRDEEERAVACDNWKQGTSLTDLFISIEDYDRKKHLLSSRVRSRTSAISEEASASEPEADYPGGDEEVSAIGYTKNTNGKFSKTYSKTYPKGGSQSESAEKQKADGTKKPPAASKPASYSMEELILRLTDTLNVNQQSQQKTSRLKVDKSTKKCYRCQEMGHFAAECPADKPAPRESEKTAEN